MAAAVADFRPGRRGRRRKIKKAVDGRSPTPIALDRTTPTSSPSSCARSRRPGQVVVGFAAETGDETGSSLEHGRAKLAAQGLRPAGGQRGVGHGRGVRAAPTTRPSCWPPTAREIAVPRGPKEALADVVWDLVAVRAALTPRPDDRAPRPRLVGSAVAASG